jgi:hypothetical protein
MADYDVQTLREGRWVTETTCPDEPDARETATRLYANKACVGVRIMRVTIRPDRSVVETEIHCETRKIKLDETIRISPLESAPPPCTTLDEYYGSASRNVIGRILRAYCDKIIVTPTEILYDIKEFKRVQDRDTLMTNSVDKVASLQVKGDEAAVKARVDDIWKMLDAIASRARKADKLNLPTIKDRFSEAITALNGIETMGEDVDHLAMVVLAKDLAGCRTWLGKLARVVRLAAAETDASALARLDGVLAEVLIGAVLQDVLGDQRSLAQAIICMVDLAEGSMSVEFSEAREIAAIINTLMATNRMTACRQVLIERAHRQLASTAPLSRLDPSKEEEEFKRVMLRLLKPNGLYWGPDTAEALTDRYARLVTKGGIVGRQAAIDGVFAALPDRATAVLYLCDLARTPYAKDCAPKIADKFETVLNTRAFADMTGRNTEPKERMRRLALAHRGILASVFPKAFKDRVATHLDALFERYLVGEKVLDRLDSGPVRERAVRLAQFCGSGMLPDGRSLAAVRARLAALLAQPDFDAQFGDGAAEFRQKAGVG